VPIHIWISACLTSRRTAFRKTVTTLVDDSGLSARIGADQLGHARPSMTQDVYMSRGQVHTEVADVLDQAVGKRDE
jgi:integrase